MGLKSLVSAKIEVKSNKDVLHHVFTHKSHHVSTMCPMHIQGCELLEGVFGTAGSKISWTYKYEGKEMISKQITEAIDDEKQMIIFKEFEGDIVNKYENFKATFHIDAKADADMVCWTIEYERPNEDLPELISLMEYIVSVTKVVDDHHVNMK
ncbi:kirola-like [Solanum pennellii]|uniref:Kirola-like n=1 Tax=Solanum pennellii TaxID=28526 RepID=A0ABM1H8K0_SOLPN|nr:kirola-like [Solanum pennellii]